jgi:hypothetical protein
MATALFLSRCASAPPPGPVPAPDAAALAGEWGIQIHLMEHTVDGTLRFTREGAAVLGSFTDDVGNQSELEKLRVGDGKIAWQMDRRDGSTLSAKGTIQGTIMSGKMKLKRREEGDSGFGVSGGGMRGGGGRRIGEPDSFSWTAVKRAESSSPPPPRP